MNTQPENILDEAVSAQHNSYRRLWCSFASAAIPGLGDFAQGDKIRGSLVLSLFFLTVIGFWPLRLPSSYWPFLLLMLAGTLLHVASACLTFMSHTTDRDSVANWWIVVSIALAIVLSDLGHTMELRASGFRVFKISSSSMSPTLEIGDDIVVDTWYFHRRLPQPGDVVAFRHHGSYLVKRVGATGGNTIIGIDGSVQLNGQAIKEQYAVHRDQNPRADEPDSIGPPNNFGPITVPAGELFVMGDNRDYSLDSRIRSGEYDYGPVFVSDLIGKPLYRFRRQFRSSGYDGQLVR